MGRPFSAVVKLDPEFKQTFDFGDAANGAQTLDFSTLPIVAPVCPACKTGAVHDTGSAYQCSNAGKCKFRMGKSICQREIPLEQLNKVIETGKTDLIPRFISKKGKPFSAYLKLDGDKIVFEFEPRKPAAKKAPTKAKTTPAAA
jgi:DNA topoisomerase-3